MTNNIYNEVLLDHNLHPLHLHELPCASCTCAGLNPTCGDQLTLHLTIEDGVMTGDLYLISKLDNKKKVDSKTFLDEIKVRLDKLM